MGSNVHIQIIMYVWDMLDKTISNVDIFIYHHIYTYICTYIHTCKIIFFIIYMNLYYIYIYKYICIIYVCLYLYVFWYLSMVSTPRSLACAQRLSPGSAMEIPKKAGRVRSKSMLTWVGCPLAVPGWENSYGKLHIAMEHI